MGVQQPRGVLPELAGKPRPQSQLVEFSSLVSDSSKYSAVGTPLESVLHMQDTTVKLAILNIQHPGRLSK